MRAFTDTDRQIWAIAWPLLISLVMEHLISMTDTAFLGRVGEVELGASALAGVYYLAMFMLGYGFCFGAQIIMGRRNGEGSYHEVGAVLTQGLVFLVALAALMFIASRALAPLVLERIITSPPIRAAAQDYMHWRVWGLFFSFTAGIFRSFFVAIAQTRMLTLNSLTMVSANVVLNYLLIFGKGGFPAMGIGGAALASALSELISLLWFAVYVWRRVDRQKYGINRKAFRRLNLIPSIMSTSVWTMLQYFLAVSVWFFFFVAMEHLGGRAIAISNVVRSISGMLGLPITAFASAASTLISNRMGEARADLVPGICMRSIVLSFVFIGPLLLLLACFPTQVLRIYTDNTDLIKSAVPSLLVMASGMLICTPGVILFNVVSGTGNTRTAMFMDCVAFGIYGLYCWLVIWHLRLDVAICWTADHVYFLGMFVLSAIYMRRGRWRERRL